MTLADKSETKSGTEHLASQFAAIVGAAHVLSEEMERALYSQDVVQWEAPLVELVVRPASADELAGAVRRAGELGLKLAPRGGGLSYSRGYVPEGGGTVLLDLGRLNRIEEVNEDDRYVTLGSGCTWKEVADTLKPLGLRTVMAGPISGNFSTVGGAASQNVPGSMDSILGLEVVLADGRIIRTGSSAMRRATSPFYRNYGPDLTGLFLGDAGAFGVKTKLTLRIERIPEGVGFASFAFGSLADMATAIVDVARLGLTVKCFGMDPLKNRTVTKVDLSEGVAMLRDVATGSGTVLRGLKDAAKLVAVGRDALDDIDWSLHLTVEEFDQTAADRALALAQEACTANHGIEIEPTLPIALRAKPFSIRGFLGLEGERWVPVHGIFPMSRAREAVVAVDEFFTKCAAELDEHEIQHSFITSTSGTYWLIEPMFYWIDEVGPFHAHYLDPKKYAKFAGNPANPAARATVMKLRAEIRDMFFELGAVSAQIGKFYDLAGALEPETYAVLTSIKDALDPDRRMNPGNLGWR